MTTETDIVDTPEALREWMERNGYTVWLLAHELGMADATVAGYMNGKHPIKRVFALALLNVPPYTPHERAVARREPSSEPTRGDRVREYLLTHYPCAVLPLGVLTEIAERFGVTRERVRQIARQLGYPGYNSLPKDQRIIRGKMGRTLCPSCGKPTGNGRYAENRVGRFRCEDCRWVDVACSECGKLKRVSASQYVARMGYTTSQGKTYTGAQFCNRVCLGRYMGKHAGFVAHPENATRGQSGHVRWERNHDRIIAAIREPRTVRELEAATGLEENAIFRHLNALKADGLADYVLGSGAGAPRIWSLVQKEEVAG